uniref:MICOS complex subunit MIC60 n=1 Tax=Glossina pallidipes TaxID=7398 RepID=A0A1B0AF28_GLOPL
MGKSPTHTEEKGAQKGITIRLLNTNTNRRLNNISITPRLLQTQTNNFWLSPANDSLADAEVEKCEIALAKAAKPENSDQIIALQEIETIFPGIDLTKQKLNLTPEDLDLFITHAYSHVLALQKELQRLQTDGELRLKWAIDSMRGDNDFDTFKAHLEYILESERRKLAPENHKKIQNIRAESEKELRQQLKKQAEAHTDHLQDVANMKESELKRQYTRELEDKMATEKANYKLQSAAMLFKIRGMDAAMQKEIYNLLFE